MESNKNRIDESVGNVILSVKAVMLLCGNSVECRDRVLEQITSRQDAEMNAFIELFQKPRKRVFPQLVMAAGEMVVAVILLFLGIGLIAPALVGFSGPAVFLHYFESTQIYLLDRLPYSPFVILIDFILAIALLSGAFYAIRESAEKIGNMGLRYR